MRSAPWRCTRVVELATAVILQAVPVAVPVPVEAMAVVVAHTPQAVACARDGGKRGGDELKKN